MQVSVSVKGLDGVLDTLRSLPPELVSRRGGPVRAALRKGAVVIHKQALANLKVSTANQPSYSTGLLQKNLVVTRGKAPLVGKGERYLVRVRRKVYPGRSGRSAGGKATTTLAAANLLEYGSSKQRAEPWLRPAFAARAEQAIRTIESELVKGVDRIVRRLAAKNKGK